jgi:RNA polymerase sigma-70 factor (ECF subfamily)
MPDPQPFGDVSEGLVARARAGDREAERLLFERLHARIHALAKRKVWDQEAAEDLAQDTLRTAYEKYRDAELPRGFLPWIFTILHHKIGNHLKRQRQQRRHVSVSEATLDWDTVGVAAGAAIDDGTGQAELMDSLEKALALTAPPCRAIFRMLLEGATREEIHRSFAPEPAGTIDSRVSRCRAKLLRDLQELHKEGGG